MSRPGAGSRGRAAIVFTAVLLAALATPRGPYAPEISRADGDPASDVLLGQDVFLPYSPVSPTVQRRLYALTASMRQAGYPIKVALIGASSDLGVVPSLFGRPERYAQFLSAELSGVVNSPVLVVMPTGFGLAVQGAARSVADLRSIPIPQGIDGLGTAGIVAARQIAAAAGHPIEASSSSTTAFGASPAATRHALVAIVVLCGLALAGGTGAIVVRRTQHGR